MQTSAINGLPTYQNSDPFDYGTQMAALVKAVDNRLVARFSTAAARNAAMGAYTAAGGVLTDGQMCTVGGFPQVYRSGSWRGLLPSVYQQPTFFDTTYSGGNEAGVATLAIPDPGFSYYLDCSMTITVSANAGSQVNCFIRLDAPAGVLMSPILNRSGSLPDGEPFTLTASETTYGPITGAHNVIATVWRIRGTGNWYVSATGNMLRAVIRPA